MITPGTRIGRYEVQALLGSGGMGEVYRAVDAELGRPVALKFLARPIASDPLRMNRFVQEARTTSALNHPNILTVYDIGQTSEGLRFFASELVDGETLRKRLQRSALTVSDALDITLQVAGALAAAHAQGVVHRDIKPENIMIRHDGYVKVLDFGLAKLTKERSPEVTQGVTRSVLSTSPGAVMGTVAYMSPEQARGEPVDARTDIWSLAVVLFETVTRHLPFNGPSPSHITVAILDEEPPPLVRFVPRAPEALQEILSDALVKDRETRIQSAKHLSAKLARLKRRLEAEAYAAGFTPVVQGQPRDVASDVGRSIGGSPPNAVAHSGPEVEHSSSRRSSRPASGARFSAADSAPVVKATYQSAGIAGEIQSAVSSHSITTLFAGHTLLCVSLALSYGAMVALALLVEVAYDWPRFADWVLPVAGLTGCASVFVTLLTLEFARRRAATGRPLSFAKTVAIFVAWSGALAVTVARHLPNEPIVLANFQTMTASVGYTKSLLEAVTLPVLSLMPIQVIFTLTYEIHAGRTHRVARILDDNRAQSLFRGIIMVPPTIAAIVFAAVSIWWLSANAHLLENLKPAPYFSLFLQLGIIRIAAGLLMLLAVLLWYTATLSDIRQSASVGPAGEHVN